MPLEGLGDVYRETPCRGVPFKPFWKFLGEHLVGMYHHTSQFSSPLTNMGEEMAAKTQ